MVDDATGRDVVFLRSFIQWANIAVWGPLDGSGGVQEVKDC